MRRRRGARRRSPLVVALAAAVAGIAPVAGPARAAADVAPGAWTAAGEMASTREGQSATLLDGPECGRPAPPAYCGRVLVAGGTAPGGPTSTAEIYDPATRGWAPTAELRAARTGHSATLLADGRVLVAGGLDGAGKPVPTAEIYEPASARRLPDGTLAQGVWTPAGQLRTPRAGATATLLAGGRVLVVGGRGDTEAPVETAEVFEPSDAAAPWRATAKPGEARRSHTATLLAGGEVLVTGGESVTGPLASTERFDPAAGTWRPGPAMARPMRRHTATRLPTGEVLVAGGGFAARFDATAAGGDGRWEDVAAMAVAREGHSATLLECAPGDARPHCGHVVVAGGVGPSGPVAGTEMFSPADMAWRPGGDLIDGRESHAAALLRSGSVLVTGGRSPSGPLASAEVFDPTVSGHPPSITALSPTGGPVSGGSSVSVTGVALTDATQVTFGDRPARALARISSTELRVTVPAQDDARVVDVTVTTPEGTSAPTNQSRFRYALAPTVTGISPDTGAASGGTAVVISGTALDFPDVHVLFGDVPATTVLSRTETALTVASPPHAPGTFDVIVYTPAGFSAPTFASRFTYGDGSWQPAAPMATPRYHHTATRLADGRVLAAGGTDNYMRSGTAFTSAELFDPTSGAWTPAASMQEARFSHTATLLDGPGCRSDAKAAWCGKVLVTGGQKQLATGTWTAIASAELYDPAANRWTSTGSLDDARFSHTATLLDGPGCADGPAAGSCSKVLVAGGTAQEVGNRPPLGTSELYDPALGTWALTGKLDAACTAEPCGRTNHTATLLPDGRVLASGGLTADPSAPGTPGTGFSSDATINGESFTSVGHTVFSPRKAPDPRAVTIANPPAGAAVEAGDRITYRIRYFNGGEETAAAVSVVMRLPRQVDLVSATGGGTYHETARSVTFPPLSIAPMTTAAEPAGTFDVVVTVRATTAPDPSGTAPPTVVRDDTAIVASVAGLPGDQVSHSFVRSAAHRVALSSTPPSGSTVAPGDEITYSLAAYNTGSTAGSPVTVADRVPDEVDFVSAAGGTFDAAARAVTFPPVAVAPGTTAEAPAVVRQITVRARDKRPDGSTIFDTSTFNDRATIGGLESNPVSHKMLRNPPASASVQLAMSADPPPGSVLHKGARITYTIGYYNAGRAQASGVVVNFKLPGRVGFVSSSAGALDAKTTTVSFPAVDVAPGSTAAAPAGSLTVTVEALGLPGGTITAAATPSSGGLSNLVEHFVVAPSVRLVATSDPLPTATVRHGDQVTYTMSYYNVSGTTAAGAVVKLQLAPEVQFVSATGGGQLDVDTRTVVFPSASVPPGTSATEPAGQLSVTVQLGLLTRPSETAEIYDPVTARWEHTQATMAIARFGHTATLLAEEPCGERCGKVLVVGGAERLGAREPFYTQTAELFDPATSTWSPAGVQDTARAYHSASVLPDGTVLVAGGAFGFPIAEAPPPVAAAEIYDPVRGTWRNTATMHDARGLHTATVVTGARCAAPGSHAACGSVLVAGGGTDSSVGTGSEPPPLASAELYVLAKLPPTVTGLDVPTGPSKGGTTVTLTGTGFEAVTAVTFGDVPGTGLAPISRGRLTVVSPPHASGVVDVVVGGAGGTSAPTPQARFTYTVSSAPSRVTDLVATASVPSEMELGFSAPASDGTFAPPATRFVVKQAAAPIVDEALFAAATTLCGGECAFAPSGVGQKLTLTIGDLLGGTTYHYALRALNDIGAAALSNSASATTLAPALAPGPADQGGGAASEPTRQTAAPSGADVRVSDPSARPTAPSTSSSASRAMPPAGTQTSTTAAGPQTSVPSPVVGAPTTTGREGASPSTAAERGDRRWWLVAAIWIPGMLGLAAFGSFLSRRLNGRGLLPSPPKGGGSGTVA